MTIPTQPSLFEPSPRSVLSGSLEWVEGLMLGPLAVTLCVLAVAIIGLVMLTGRLPVRMVARTILGCFILLGAPAIASALMLVDRGNHLSATAGLERASPPPRANLPPANNDPYSGASLRRE